MTKRLLTTWYLVADASRARIVAHDEKDGYRKVFGLAHPASRAKTSDLVSDTNGRKSMGVSGGGYGHPGVAPDTDPKEVEHQKFARELAHELERGLNEHAYDQLTLIAPPHFLGLLKGTLSEQVTKRINETLSKDFAQLSPAALVARLVEIEAA